METKFRPKNCHHMTWLRDVVPLPADFTIAVFHLFLLAPMPTLDDIQLP